MVAWYEMVGVEALVARCQSNPLAGCCLLLSSLNRFAQWLLPELGCSCWTQLPSAFLLVHLLPLDDFLAVLPVDPLALCTAIPSVSVSLAAPFPSRSVVANQWACGRRCDSISGQAHYAMIAALLPHCSIHLQSAFICRSQSQNLPDSQSTLLSSRSNSNRHTSFA